MALFREGLGAGVERGSFKVLFTFQGKRGRKPLVNHGFTVPFMSVSVCVCAWKKVFWLGKTFAGERLRAKLFHLIREHILGNFRARLGVKNIGASGPGLEVV